MARLQHYGVFSNGHDPEPKEAARARLCALIEAHCAAAGDRPVDLVAAEAWRVGGQGARRRIYHRVTIECSAGTCDRAVRSWLAWQHPRWDWSPLDCPVAGVPA